MWLIDIQVVSSNGDTPKTHTHNSQSVHLRTDVLKHTGIEHIFILQCFLSSAGTDRDVQHGGTHSSSTLLMGKHDIYSQVPRAVDSISLYMTHS